MTDPSGPRQTPGVSDLPRYDMKEGSNRRMLPGLAYLLVFQLAGEIVVRGLGVPLPGPVLGLAFMLLFLRSGRVSAAVEPVARVLLANLSLLFVPAGVGVVGHLDVIAESGAAIMIAIVASTVAALSAAAWIFVWVSKLTGAQGE